MAQQFEITLPPFKRGYHLIDSYLKPYLTDLPEVGICHIFIKHTSASLTLNENADPSVRDDFESSLNRIVPQNKSLYTHTLEGNDDMPAHIKASLLGSSVSIPITHHRLNKGTWQGVYLCEFRDYPSSRSIIVTILG